MKNIYCRFREGNLEDARSCQDRIRSFRNCFRYGNPNTVVKTAVALLGHAVGKCRKPFDYLPEEGIGAIRQVLLENEKLGMR